MLYLNLLPKQEKTKIKLERLYSLLKKETVFLLIVLVLLNIEVFYVKKILKQNLTEIQSVLQQNKEKENSLIIRVTTFNQNIDSFKKIQAKFFNKSKVFLRLSKLIPHGISLTSINLKENNELVLQGNSQNRDQLLKFKNNLNNGFMVNIDFPISNLLKQDQNSFLISGTVSGF